MTTPNNPVVIGLDVSTTVTGVAIVGGVHPDPYTDTIDATDKATIGERLDVLHTAIGEFLNPRPALIVMEDLPRNAKSAAVVGMAQGVTRLRIHRAQVPVVFVPPATVKAFATGKGNANKLEVVLAASRRLRWEGTDDNEADALWLAMLGVHAIGGPVPVPAAHTQKSGVRAAAANVCCVAPDVVWSVG